VPSGLQSRFESCRGRGRDDVAVGVRVGVCVVAAVGVALGVKVGVPVALGVEVRVQVVLCTAMGGYGRGQAIRRYDSNDFRPGPTLNQASLATSRRRGNGWPAGSTSNRRLLGCRQLH
jgi:hypothetical protein